MTLPGWLPSSRSRWAWPATGRSGGGLGVVRVGRPAVRGRRFRVGVVQARLVLDPCSVRSVLGRRPRLRGADRGVACARPEPCQWSRPRRADRRADHRDRRRDRGLGSVGLAVRARPDAVAAERMSSPAPVREFTLTRARLVLLAAASLVAPLWLGLQSLTGKHVDVSVFVGATVIGFLLVIARMWGLMRLPTVPRQLLAPRTSGQPLELPGAGSALRDALCFTGERGSGLALPLLVRGRLAGAATGRHRQPGGDEFALTCSRSSNSTGPSSCRSPRSVLPRLPADRRVARRSPDRRRGTGPLASPQPRRRVAARLHRRV